MSEIRGVVAPGNGGIKLPRSVVRELPRLAEVIVCSGLHRRAGHRPSYEGVDWSRYRARVGIFQQRGPWSVVGVVSTADDLTAKSTRAQGLPHEPGLYTVLQHRERGLVMADTPAEIAGCLDFLDHATGRVLVNGLGLGIVPFHLLAYRPVTHVDVVELDADVIHLITDGCHEEGAPNAWAADPRLVIHHADAHIVQWAPRTRWDCAWHDIWDQVTVENLPSMRLLHRRYAHRVGWQMSWEREECLARRRRRRGEQRAAAEFLDRLRDLDLATAARDPCPDQSPTP